MKVMKKHHLGWILLVLINSCPACSEKNRPSHSEALSQIRPLVDKGELSAYRFISETQFTYINGFAQDASHYVVVSRFVTTILYDKAQIVDIMRQHPDIYDSYMVEAVPRISDYVKGHKIEDEVRCAFLRTENGWIIQPSKDCGYTEQ